MQSIFEVKNWRRLERQRLLALREVVPDPLRLERNATVTSLLEQGFPLLRQMTVGFCWPYKGEFDARFLIHALRPHGARAALPEVVARDMPLVFREWWPGVAMTPRVFDLPVPDDTPVVLPHALLIPPVGFDTRGYRLGYGGGYFDRTLAARPVQPLKIGVAFEISRIPTIRPQPHDVPMDFIVTEAGILAVDRKGLLPVDAEECAERAQVIVTERLVR